MTPSFALTLDHDAIVLLFRKASAWREVGSVALDSEDLGGELAGLRQQAERLTDGDALRSTLVLPNSQILYTTAAAGADATENAAIASKTLEGATPYALEELVFDWKVRGDEICIAAVARETLEEAEEFAVQHGFGPLCFTATPEAGAFPGAPFLGPSDSANRFLGPGEILERVARPIETSGPLECDEAPERLEPPTEIEATSEPEEVASPEMEHIDAGAVSDDDLQRKDAAEEVETDAALAPEVENTPEVSQSVPETRLEETDGEPVAEIAEAASLPPEEDDTAAIAPPPESDAAPIADMAIEETVVQVAETALAPAEEVAAPAPAPIEDIADEAPSSEEPSEVETIAEISEPEPAPDQAASDTPEETPAAPAPGFRSIRQPEEPPVSAAEKGPIAPASGKHIASKPLIAERPDMALSSDPSERGKKTKARRKHTRKMAGAATPVADTLAAEQVRPADSAFKVPKAPPDPTRISAPPAAPKMSEAEALTVFGARKSQNTSGTIGGAKIAAAVAGTVAVGLIALWSILGGKAADELTGTSPPAELTAQAPAIEPAGAAPVSANTTSRPPQDTTALAPAEGADASQDVQLADNNGPSPEGSTSTENVVASPVAIPPEDLTDVEPDAATVGIQPMETQASLSTSQNLQTDAAEASPPDDSDTQLASLADSATAPILPEQPSGAPAPQEEIAQPEIVPTPLDPTQARAAYAVSGIWQRAPERGFEPREDTLDDFYLTSIDGDLDNQDALALPEPNRKLELRPLEPRAPRIPTSAGTVAEGPTPGGVEIRLGKPDIVPPRRPDSIAPLVAGEAGAQDDATPAVVDEALQGVRPRQRPDGLIEANEKVVLGGRTLAELGQLRPQRRPTSVQETAAALDTAQQMAEAETAAAQAAEAVLTAEEAALAEDLRTATGRAVAASPQPRLRPANISQIADRARKRAEQEARAIAEAEQAVREKQEADARARVAAAASQAAKQEEARKQAAIAAAQAEKERQEAAAKAAKEAERAEQAAARSRGPAVPRSQRIKPNATTPAAVASRATTKNAVSLSRVALIGVYGTSSQRRALVRLPSGKYIKVKVGDRIDGGRVAAIGSSDLRYSKGGRTVTLKMPKG